MLIDIAGASEEAEAAVAMEIIATETVAKATKEAKGTGELDDYEFWLSTDTPAEKKVHECVCNALMVIIMVGRSMDCSSEFIYTCIYTHIQLEEVRV